MKLATLQQGGRDGTLVVVSRDLTRCRAVPAIARTMLAAMDEWDTVEQQLRQVYEALNSGAIEGEAFDQAACHSPLPRTWQWADGSAYINHVELVRRARHSEVPESFYTDPLMYQGGSDGFVDPRAKVVAQEAWGIDFEAEVTVVTGDIPMGATPAQAAKAIRLVMLVNDVSLRNLIPNELAKGFGFFQSKPATAFSPVAVTLDELGDAWDKGRVNLTVQSTWNGRRLACATPGPR